jgi:hypothetical protein
MCRHLIAARATPGQTGTVLTARWVRVGSESAHPARVLRGCLARARWLPLAERSVQSPVLPTNDSWSVSDVHPSPSRTGMP